MIDESSLSLSKEAAPFLNPLVVALDVDSDTEARSLARELAPVAGGFKLGPRLVTRYGGSFIQDLAELAPVFVDLKHFDIPSTMVAAVEASFAAGASVVTVHALSGKEALTQLSQLEARLNKTRPFLILAVTVLTSWEEESFPPSLQPWSLKEHVHSLADLVLASGLRGLVCSPQELLSLQTRPAYFLTPGIRSSSDSLGDQKRTLSARSAMEAGANALVVGRPIIQAASPLQAAERLLAEIQEAPLG